MCQDDLFCLCFCDLSLSMAGKCSLLGGGYPRTEFQNSVGSWLWAHFYGCWGGVGAPVRCRAWCGVAIPSFLGVVGNCPSIFSSCHGVSYVRAYALEPAFRRFTPLSLFPSFYLDKTMCLKTAFSTLPLLLQQTDSSRLALQLIPLVHFFSKSPEGNLNKTCKTFIVAWLDAASL